MKTAALIIPLFLFLAATSGEARTWQAAPGTVDPWDDRTESHLGISANEILGYAQASEWADEIQISFELPEPELQGPWLVEYVAFFMSGGGTHQVTVRSAAALGAVPGPVQASGVEFTPLYTSWPPAGWTYVSLRTDVPCPAHLTGGAGDIITIGTDLLPGDMIGIAGAEDGIRGWGFFDGSWMDDSGALQVMPTVRIGISDLGTSQASEATWGSIKDLFK